VTKVVVVLHETGLGDRLLAPSYRKSLASVGATAVQVNLDDDAVAAALRFGPGEPVTALVSVHTEGDPSAVVAATAEAAGEPDLHAYRVTEKVRLDPLPVADGERADVYAQVALLRWSADLTREEYLTYWQVHHTPIAIRTQNTSGYVQNLVEEALTPSSPEDFPMTAMTDPHEFYGSRGDEEELSRRMTELMASVARFGADQGLDLVPTSRYRWML